MIEILEKFISNALTLAIGIMVGYYWCKGTVSTEEHK